MSDVPVWNCEFFPLKGDGTAALDSLTVGARFGWKCHGDIAVAWDGQKPVGLAFKDKEQDYTLAILKTVRQDPNDVQYEVTAYKPGDHKPEFIRVLQGQGTAAEIGFEAVKPAWTVKSVLNPNQPPQPYGALGPWSLAIPLWFMVTVALVLAAIAYMIFRVVRKSTQRRRMLEELARHRTALLPLHQFFRDARNLRRRLQRAKEIEELKKISDDLDREFRLYILRQFQIPALDWTNQDILRDLRRRHRKTHRAASEPLKRTLRELMKLKARGSVDAKDLEQMYTMSLETAEKLEAARLAGGRL